MLKRCPFIIITLVLMLLLSLSAIRLVSQFVVSTDRSSLFPTALSTILSMPRSLDVAQRHQSPLEASHFSLNTLTLKTMVKLDPFNSDYRYLMARELAQIQPLQAEQVALKAVRLNMIDPKNWLLLGWIEGKKGNIQRGYSDIDKAVMLDPRRPDSYAQQGLYLYYAGIEAGSREKPLYNSLAMLSLKTALEADRTLYGDPYVSITAAALYQESGYPGYAIRVLNAIPDDALTWPPAIKKIVMLCEMGEVVKALFTWKRLFIPGYLSPEDLEYIEREIGQYELPECAYFLAQIHIVRGKYDKALRELTGLVSKKGANAEYKVALASVHERMSNHAEASRLYEEALRLSPANQEAKRKVMQYYARGNR